MTGALAILALVGVLAAPEPARVPLEGPERLARFFASLRALQDEPDAGRVRVMHLGDSHVAADQWTAPLREGLQQRFGDGGRGFVLPGRPWLTFWQSHLASGAEGPWRTDGLPGGLDDGFVGPGGCSVASESPEAQVVVGTPTRGETAATFSSLDVAFVRQPNGGCFEVRIDGAPMGVVPTRGPWIEPGFARFDVAPGPHRVEVRPRSGGETRLLGFSMENRSGVAYDALGINGAQAERLLRSDPASLAAVLARLKPGLLVLSYGTNEVFDRRFDPNRYAATLRRVVTRLRGAVPEADCLLTGPGDFHVKKHAMSAIATIIDVQRFVAQEQGCAFWDARAAMGGPGTIRKWKRAGLAQGDLVHLTREGYERVGGLLLKAIIDAYEGRDTGRGTKAGDQRPATP